MEEAQRRTAEWRVVMIELQGETTVAEAARKHAITVEEIEQRRDGFRLGAGNALRARPKDEAALREEGMFDAGNVRCRECRRSSRGVTRRIDANYYSPSVSHG